MGRVLLSLSVPQRPPDKMRLHLRRIPESFSFRFVKISGANSSGGVELLLEDQGRVPAQPEGLKPLGRELTSLNAPERPFW